MSWCWCIIIIIIITLKNNIVQHQLVAVANNDDNGFGGQWPFVFDMSSSLLFCWNHHHHHPAEAIIIQPNSIIENQKLMMIVLLRIEKNIQHWTTIHTKNSENDEAFENFRLSNMILFSSSSSSTSIQSLHCQSGWGK